MLLADNYGAYQRMSTVLSVAGKMDPPPFGTTGKREAWRSGYEDALRDVAWFFAVTEKTP